jgi:NAD+ kinase
MMPSSLRPDHHRGDIEVVEAVPAKRALLLSHRAPEALAGALPAVLGILDAAGVEVLVSPGEVEKHPVLGDRPSAEGVTLSPGGADIVLVLGGDGSILRALSEHASSGAPVVGVNFGRVGFLASVERTDLERGLRRVAEDRVLLDLALGGPAVSWRVRCFVLSFLAAHHLEARPLVIGASEVLTVTNDALVGDCDVLVDGRRVGSLAPARTITIGLDGPEVHLATFPEGSFFRRYRDKFGRQAP